MKLNPIPDELRGRPFTTREAMETGVSRGALSGHQYVRVHRGVYVVAGTPMDFGQRVAAARLALPDDAHLSHLTRIQQLGLDIGARSPLHFTVARDLHVTPRGIFLHRTKALPPLGDGGVSAAVAFLSISAELSLLDVIVIGDWLLHNEHMSTEELSFLAHRDAWRPGASQALQALPHLNERSASPQESRMRAFVVFAGLPEPLVNVALFDDPNSPILDLYFRAWMLALEYEGRHHFRDSEQIRRDIWRYGELRGRAVEYLQVYDEMLASPRAFVLRVHELLRRRGYVGPEPDFGTRWQQLARPLPHRPVPASSLAVG